MSSPVPQKSAVPLGSVLSLVAAILYGVSPIDLIPDVIVLLGWLDDAIAIPGFIGLALMIFLRHRHLLKKTGKSVQQSGVVDVVAREPQIPQSYDQVR